MKAETELFLLSSVTPHTPQEVLRINQLIQEGIDWDRFQNICQVNNYCPQIYCQFEKLSLLDVLPIGIQKAWERECQQIKEKFDQRFSHAKIFLKAFVDQNIPVVILKGSAFSHYIYQNPYYKKSNDIDILIKQNDLPQIYKIYEDLGYIPFGERIKNDKKVQEKFAWNATPYVSRDLSLIIGTQWGFKTTLGPYRVDYEKIWTRIEPLNFLGINVAKLSAEDNLLHLALHFSFFKTHMKDLADVTNLIRFHRHELNWGYLIQTAIDAKVCSHLYQILFLSQKVSFVSEVEVVLTKIRPYVWPHYYKGLAKKTANMDDFVFMSVDWIQEMEIRVSEFIRCQTFTQRVKASFKLWWNTFLFPPYDVMCKINFDLKPNLMNHIYYRLISPYRILRAAAEEISWLVVGILGMKTVVDIVLSPLQNISMQAKQKSPYSGLAKEIGTTEDQIKKLVRELT